MDILQQNLGPSEDAVEARVGDETVLLQRQRGTYYSLDPMGTRVWTLLKDGRSALEICALLAEEFGVEKAEVIEMPNASHYLIQSNQPEVLQAIEAFAARLPAS